LHPDLAGVLNELAAGSSLEGQVITSERGGAMTSLSIVVWFGRAYLVVAAFCGFTSLALVSRDADLPLQVMIQGQGLSIQNMGDRPITINQVGVNNLPECRPKQYTDQLLANPLSNIPQQPQKLRTGEKAVWLTQCNIVNVEVVTDQGSETFSDNN
jgi:hypothetical protein